jgi:hypothetical protein
MAVVGVPPTKFFVSIYYTKRNLMVRKAVGGTPTAAGGERF